MAAASRWCGVKDWNALFSATIIGDRVRLIWREPPLPTGVVHPRAQDATCILDTFGTMTATNQYFEFPVSSLRATIAPRRID
jgi:hypothetical protein